MLEPQRQAGSNLSFLSIGCVRKGRLHLLRDGRRRTGGSGDEDEAEDCDDGERHQVLRRPCLRRRPRHRRAATTEGLEKVDAAGTWRGARRWH